MMIDLVSSIHIFHDFHGFQTENSNIELMLNHLYTKSSYEIEMSFKAGLITNLKLMLKLSN